MKGSRCPVGQRIEVNASFGSAQEMTDVGPADAAGNHVGRGRKRSATATIGSGVYSQSDYAVITEAKTVE